MSKGYILIVLFVLLIGYRTYLVYFSEYPYAYRHTEHLIAESREDLIMYTKQKIQLLKSEGGIILKVGQPEIREHSYCYNGSKYYYYDYELKIVYFNNTIINWNK